MKQPSKKDALNALDMFTITWCPDEWTAKIVRQFIESVDSTQRAQNVVINIEAGMFRLTDKNWETLSDGKLCANGKTTSFEFGETEVCEDCTEKDARISELESTIDAQDTACEFCKKLAEIERLRKRIAHLEHREETLVTGWRNAEKRYEAEIAELEKQNDALEDRYDSLQEDFQNRETELLEKIAELEKHVERYCKIVGEKDARIEQLERYTENIDVPSYDSGKEYTEEEARTIVEQLKSYVSAFGFSVTPGQSKVFGYFMPGISGVDGCNVANTIKYKPPLQPPVEDRVVLLRDPCGVTKIGFSRGNFEQGTTSLLYSYDFNGAAWINPACKWSDYEDPSHHSHGWKTEWNPEK